MEAHKPEYQHFIPQFLLRNFSHKYAPADKSKAGKPKKRDRKKMYSGEPAVNSLCLSDEFLLDECPVRRACGLENMYVDTAKPLKHQGHLEKKFGVFENKASCIYRKIVKAYEDGKPAIFLKRSEKDVLRKFMFLLAYRGEQYHRKYNLDGMQDYDDGDKELLQIYMAKHGFTKPIDVWLQSLETIIDLDIDPEGCWKQRISESIYFPIAVWFIDHICDMYMAICTPASHDEEFVLTDNCYNVDEGQTTAYYDQSTGKHISLCPRFHKFAPISPKLMIVLRSNLLPEPLGDADPAMKQQRQFERQLWIDAQFGSGTKSILEDLPIRKAMNGNIEIVNGRLVPKSGWDQRPGINDSFCFTIFKIPTRHVRTINGLLIDHAFHGSKIIFDRKDVFLDLIEWYLTEPCKVGKNLTGKDTFKQMEYIAGLSKFMLREGREINPTMNIWPSEDRDLRQFQLQSLAGAQFLEKARCGKDGIGSGFIAVYERLGGTVATRDEDMAMANTMLQTWTSGLESIQDISLFDEDACRGLEDILAYAHPLIQGHELNVAMYKSFNESMALTRGAGCGLESMGFFSLYGDEKWRIPASFSLRNQPWENEVKDGPNIKKTVRSSVYDGANRKASTQSPHRNQWFDHHVMKEKVGARKATRSSLFDTENRKIPTSPIEQTKTCDDNKEKDEIDGQKTDHNSQFHKKGRKLPADPKEEAYGPGPTTMPSPGASFSFSRIAVRRSGMAFGHSLALFSYPGAIFVGTL
ncbi:hypothetical protein MKX08_001300 [Trichoderma sp. CBMAI-0020]|nr:hypothetical protein MKX08_001300 [Trichoderma sp. CBMAI-0020]